MKLVSKVQGNIRKRNQLNRMIPIREIETLIRHKNGKYKQVLKVTDPLNLDLMGREELEQAVDAVQSALNTNREVDQTCQILITSDPVDIDSYLWELGQKVINAKKQGQSYSEERLRKKMQYLEEHRHKASNTHNFYLVLESRSKKREHAEVELNDQVSTVTVKLMEAGMKVERVEREQAQKMIYERLLPNTHITRPYKRGMDLMAWRPPDIPDHGDYIEIDRAYFRFYTLSYIPTPRRAGWIEPLLFSSSVSGDISITLRTTSKADMIKNLNGKITEYESMKLGHIPESAKQYYDDKIESNKKLIREIRPESEQLFKTTFVIAIGGNSVQELESNCTRFVSGLSDLEVKPLRYHGANLYYYFLPIGHSNAEVERRYHWPLYAKSAASMLPFNSPAVNYNRGILKGFNVKTQEPVLVDGWDQSEHYNRNEFWLGRTGAGKTWALANELHREYYAGEADRQIIIDIERDYHKFFPWGNRIVFSPGADYCTNPFHIRSYVVDSNNNGDDVIDLQAYLPKKTSSLKTFFRWIYPDMTGLEEAKLAEAITACYAEFGLFYRKPGEEKVDLELPDQFPTMSDLDRHLANMDGMENLRIVLRPYVEGEYATIFNGQQSWDMENPMNILDIHDLDKSVQKPLMHLLISQIWEEIKRDRKEKMLLVIDELGLVADERNQQAMEFVHDMAKRIRKYGGGLITATQNVADFLSAGRWGTAVINNCEFQHFMGLKSHDIKMLVKEMEVEFSKKEMKIIKKDKAQGHGLFVISNQKRIEMQTDCSDDELRSLNLTKATDDQKDTDKKKDNKDNVVSMVVR